MTLARLFVAAVAFMGIAAHAMAEEEAVDVHTVDENLYCNPSNSPCTYEKSLGAHTRYNAYTFCGTEASHTYPKSIHCSSPSTIVDCAPYDVYECQCNENNAAVGYKAKTKITC